MSNDDVIDLCNDNDDENTTEFEVRKGETLNFVSDFDFCVHNNTLTTRTNSLLRKECVCD